MLQASKFRVDMAHVVAFTSVSSDFSPNALLSCAMSESPIDFNGDISILPLPPDAPPEIPRVVLASREKHWRLQASRISVDVSWTSQDRTEVIPREAIDNCATILGRYFDRNKDATLKRLGLIVSRSTAVEAPARELIDRFCSEEVTDPNRPLLRNSKAFELHNLKQFKLANEFKINSWVRCKTGSYKAEPKIPAVVIEQDLNTQDLSASDDSESPPRPADITRFFRLAHDAANAIISLYFPG